MRRSEVLAPQGQQLQVADVARVVLAYFGCRSRMMRAAFLSILRSEAFSVAAGFFMAAFMLAFVWFTCSIFY